MTREEFNNLPSGTVFTHKEFLYMVLKGDRHCILLFSYSIEEDRPWIIEDPKRFADYELPFIEVVGDLSEVLHQVQEKHTNATSST